MQKNLQKLLITKRMLNLRTLDGYKLNNNTGKYYKVYDESGNFLYNINKKDEGTLTDQYLRGVTCFVINENGEILVEKRADTELTPRKLDLVSGHIDGEEVGTQAIIRELREEVGIPVQKAQNVHKVGSRKIGFESEGSKRNFFIEFYYLLLKDSKVNISSEEVNSLEWIPMEKVFEMIKQGETKFPRQSESLDYEEIFNEVKNAYLNLERDVEEREF